MKLSKDQLYKLILETLDGPAGDQFNLYDSETKHAFVRYYEMLLAEFGSKDNPRFQLVEKELTKMGNMLDKMHPEPRKWIIKYFEIMKLHKKFKE